MSVQLQKASLPPESFVLCERNSGAVLFRVDADSDGSLPVEKTAGLLAVHCLVRGQTPEDYEVMVVARESLLHAVAERARQLLAAGRAIGAGIRISRREREVLNGILQSLTNKEIASTLNVSARTVKFHVSSLLAKFGVADRISLGREAAMYCLPGTSAATRNSSPGLLPAQTETKNAEVENSSRPDSARPSPKASGEITHDVRGARSRVFPMIPRERYAT